MNDSLDDTTALPELSFDDLLDESPTKKGVRSSFDDDPLDMDHDGQVALIDQTLNTPKPKKPPPPIVRTVMLTPSSRANAITLSEYKPTNIRSMALAAANAIAIPSTLGATSGSEMIKSTSMVLASSPTKTPVGGKQVTLATSSGGKMTFRATPTTMPTSTGSGSGVAGTTPVAVVPPGTTMLFNNRKLLQNVTIQGSVAGGTTMRVAPRPATASVATSAMAALTTSPTKPTIMGGKVAVKTANGQIIYIQKTSAVRPKPQAAGAIISAATATTAPTATATTSTVFGAAKVMTMPTTARPIGTVAAVATTPTRPIGAVAALATTATRPSGSVAATRPIGTLASVATITPHAAAPTTPTSAAKAAVTVGGSPPKGGKTVSIQLIRTRDGALIKPAASSTSANKALTISPAVASQLAGKKLGVTTPPAPLASSSVPATLTGNQVYIKGPLKAGGMTQLASAGGTGAAATTSPKSLLGPRPAGKLVQTPNGGTVVVTNPQLIKMSPRPTVFPGVGNAGAGCCGTAAKIQAIQISKGTPLQAIQIPGKGLQPVRVIPKISTGAAPAAATNNASSGTTTATTTVATTASSISSSPSTTNCNSGVIGTSTTPAATPSTSSVVAVSPVGVVGSGGKTSGVPTTSMIKFLNSKKFTVVRPNTAIGKFMLTPTSKTEGGNTSVTFSPVTSKVQKTIVTVPSPRPGTTDGEHKKSPVAPNASKAVRIVSAFGLHGGDANAGGQPMEARKHKISDLNSEIQRITSSTTATSGKDDSDLEPPLTKKAMNGANSIVVLSRTMVRPGGAHKIFPSRPGSVLQRVAVQNSSSNVKTSPINGPTVAMTTQQGKKYFRVLKGTTAEMKSRLIYGQAQAQAHTQQSKMPQPQSKASPKFQQQIKAVSLLQSPQPVDRIASTSTAAAAAAAVAAAAAAAASAELSVVTEEMLNVNYVYKGITGTGRSKLSPASRTKNKDESADIEASLEVGGVVRRKHCNCSKSQCLKLYCDCFANGEFCQNCTCKDCFNNLQYEDERQRAIKTCLERNPSAFKPKITSAQDQSDMRQHNKGCNCKRSGCLKNYCECYEAKIPCSSNCKCVGCRNVEDRPDLDLDPVYSHLAIAMGTKQTGSHHHIAPKRTYERANYKYSERQLRDGKMAMLMRTSDDFEHVVSPPEKSQVNFITTDVIDATIQCMLSQADECEKSHLPSTETQKLIMEELGRCLVEIIDFSIRNTDSSFSQE